MKRWLVALLSGGLLVALAALLGKHQIATPIPFFVLLPGILAGAMVPGSGFNPEGDTHPWGLLSLIVVWAVNVLLYALLAWVVLRLAGAGLRNGMK